MSFMTPRRWQIVGGYAFTAFTLSLYNFTVVPEPFVLFSWWSLGGLVLAVISIQTGQFIVREWQEAGANHGNRWDDNR
jgi:hypothetical protein